jgi:hypothetical protein
MGELGCWVGYFRLNKRISFFLSVFVSFNKTDVNKKNYGSAANQAKLPTSTRCRPRRGP